MISLLSYILAAIIALAMSDGSFLSLLLWTVPALLIVWAVRAMVLILIGAAFIGWLTSKPRKPVRTWDGA